MTTQQALAVDAQLISGNQAIARGVWEAGVRVAAAYPGTPSTEILENLKQYSDIHAHWATNEKVALEVAIGASLAGSRAFCAMKHVGLNVASDALMSQTLAGVAGGLVIAVADDVGLSSSQNEQDSRFWGRFAHVPLLEPADSQEAYEMTLEAFDLSERFDVPVILRLTTRICHVKGLVRVGERRVAAPERHFERDASRWVMVPGNAKRRLGVQLERDRELAAWSETSTLQEITPGTDRRVGFVASGPVVMQVREAFPEAPLFKLGQTWPVPAGAIRRFGESCDHLVVVEETEPLMETDLRAAGVAVQGKDILPRTGEITARVLKQAVARLLDGAPAEGETLGGAALEVFPRPPTMCVGCPHIPAYYCLSRLTRKVHIMGDIGCYTLGAGQPWKALDSATCMGASMGMALGMDLGRTEVDKDKAVVAVIGDSTFLHMGLQGLIDITYNKGNVTVMLLDNSTTAMTGGQDHAATGRALEGGEAPRVDFVQLVQALGVRPERVKVVDPYEMPTLFKTIREEIATPEPSVIITNQPCVLIDKFDRRPPYQVIDDQCTGCSNCLNTGCPAIHVTRRESRTLASGKTVDKSWVTIDTLACTGCGLCPETCGPDAIVLKEFAAETVQ